MKTTVISTALILVSSILAGAPTTTPPTLKASGTAFYVYTERGSKNNHWIPSGYMGDYSDIKMSQAYEKEPGKGKTCIKVEYTAERKQNAGWAGVYWQHPVNNWGDKRGGYDLTGFSKVRFMARGDKGGEIVDKFGIGGITGQTEDGDSDSSATDMIELTKEWKEYTIDLTGLDLRSIIGGFLWVANAESNPQGFTIYIDEIRYEK